METIVCDFCVAGGGLAGICAAVAGARMGLSVVLINDRPVLGGNASSEYGVTIEGAGHHGYNCAVYSRENGIIEEIRLKIAHYLSCGGYGKNAAVDAVLLETVIAEKNIRLMQNTSVFDCEVVGGKIELCRARHTVNNAVFTVKAQIYADCTGNGILGAAAGAQFVMGREAKSEYNEEHAPLSADSFTMGNTLAFETENAGHRVKFVAPDFAYDISKMEFTPGIDRKENFRKFRVDKEDWTYEFGGQMDTLKDCDDIELELKKLTYGIWDYIKNSGKYPEAENYVLKRVYPKSGMRESRRFIGDYVINENDIAGKADYEDAVCIGGWPMDVHAPLGIYDSAPASNFISVRGLYNIPFRCLYSKDVSNLAIAGRIASATHIAMGSMRVMATCGAMGQAVGTAAAIAKKYGVSLREVQREHINELKELLTENDQSIIGRKRKANTNFTVKAGSELFFENIDDENGGYMKLERDYAVAFAVGKERIDSFKVKIKADTDTVLYCKILAGSYPDAFIPDRLVKSFSVNIKGRTDDFINVPVNESPGTDGKIYIVFCENPYVQIGITKKQLPGAVTMRMHREGNCDGKNHDSVVIDVKTGYTHYDFIYEKERNIQFCAIEPAVNVFAAENVLNGYMRPYGGMNMWKSSKCRDERLVLMAKEPTDVNSVEIVFDNDLHAGNFSDALQSVAKKYKVRLFSGENVKEICETNNYLRVKKFSVKMKNVDKIEILLEESNGSGFGIYGIFVK